MNSTALTHPLSFLKASDDATELLVINLEVDPNVQEVVDKTPLDIELVPEDKLFARATIKVPWKDDSRPPLNRLAVIARDRKVTARSTEDQRSLYDVAVATLIDGGFAEYSAEGGKHYIAFTPVFKEGKNTKCRLCLDASIINNYTRQGDYISRDLIDCVILFRSQEYCSIFDISKAFWRIALSKNDTPFHTTVVNGRPLRFLRWRPALA